jgi:hypothetical protein
VKSEKNAVARAWLGDSARFSVFQWHGETFSIPPHATRILTGQHCRNQAFVLGKHLGMQCHVEMTQKMIEQWCADGAREIEMEVAQHRAVAVQETSEILRVTPVKLPALHTLADTLYRKWVEGLISTNG